MEVDGKTVLCLGMLIDNISCHVTEDAIGFNNGIHIRAMIEETNRLKQFLVKIGGKSDQHKNRIFRKQKDIEYDFSVSYKYEDESKNLGVGVTSVSLSGEERFNINLPEIEELIMKTNKRLCEVNIINIFGIFE